MRLQVCGDHVVFLVSDVLSLIIYSFLCCLFFVQIDLMVSGNQPVKAMTHICGLTLFWIVFKVPLQVEPEVLEGCEMYD